MNENYTPVLHNIADTAKLLGCNISYVHKLRKSGLLPVIKLGSYKVRHEALCNFLEKYEGYDLTDPEHPVELTD